MLRCLDFLYSSPNVLTEHAVLLVGGFDWCLLTLEGVVSLHSSRCGIFATLGLRHLCWSCLIPIHISSFYVNRVPLQCWCCLFFFFVCLLQPEASARPTRSDPSISQAGSTWLYCHAASGQYTLLPLVPD